MWRICACIIIELFFFDLYVPDYSLNFIIIGIYIHKAMNS